MAREAYYVEMMRNDWRDYVRPAKAAILEERVRQTIACRESDDLPRDPSAGECFVDEEGRAVQVMHNGLRVLYGRYYGSWVNEIIYGLRGVHEPQEERIFHDILRQLPPGATMLEAGCYWGYYAMWFARTVPDGRTYLVEPHSGQIRIARQNFALNGVTGDFTAGYFGSYPEKKKAIQERRAGPLPRLTVPGFMAAKRLDRLTLLHADIQCHEEEMLADAAQALADRRIDWLFIATHGTRHPACRAILDAASYAIVAEREPIARPSTDGLIVARSPALPTPS